MFYHFVDIIIIIIIIKILFVLKVKHRYKLHKQKNN